MPTLSVLLTYLLLHVPNQQPSKSPSRRPSEPPSSSTKRSRRSSQSLSAPRVRPARPNSLATRSRPTRASSPFASSRPRGTSPTCCRRAVTRSCSTATRSCSMVSQREDGRGQCRADTACPSQSPRARSRRRTLVVGAREKSGDIKEWASAVFLLVLFFYFNAALFTLTCLCARAVRASKVIVGPAPGRQSRASPSLRDWLFSEHDSMSSNKR